MSEKKNIWQKIIAVRKTVGNIDKNMTVGTGKAAYKGVSDKEVKQQIGDAMAEQGLVIRPIKYEPTFQIDRWEEDTEWGKKQRQMIFCSVLATYEITDAETEQSIIIQGYGHGADPQDKAAGKATTYALKNALLYSYLIPTGRIDDTDNEHSSNLPTPPANQDNRPWMTERQFEQAKKRIENGEKGVLANASNSLRMKRDYRTELEKLENG